MTCNCNSCLTDRIKELERRIEALEEVSVHDLEEQRFIESTMLKVAGKNFKCSCECNVFSKVYDFQYGTIYVCNACGLEYQGE